MSILESFIKLVDPATAQQREQERKSAREQPKREASGGPPLYACRICGHESEDSGYCPHCLADTMKRVQRGRSSEP